MIRRATVQDFPRFLELVRRFRARLETYQNCPVDEASVMQTFHRCVSSPGCLALVAEHDGQLTGGLLAITQELWWTRSREATDAMIYAETAGDGFRMARRYLRWAYANPRVAVVTLSHSAGGDIERAVRFQEALGLKTIGVISQGANPSFGVERRVA